MFCVGSWTTRGAVAGWGVVLDSRARTEYAARRAEEPRRKQSRASRGPRRAPVDQGLRMRSARITVTNCRLLPRATRSGRDRARCAAVPADRLTLMRPPERTLRLEERLVRARRPRSMSCLVVHSARRTTQEPSGSSRTALRSEHYPIIHIMLSKACRVLPRRAVRVIARNQPLGVAPPRRVSMPPVRRAAAVARVRSCPHQRCARSASAHTREIVGNAPPTRGFEGHRSPPGPPASRAASPVRAAVRPPAGSLRGSVASAPLR